ncbi:MAG: YicC family protein, partial [Cytophagaceae bacterium]
MIKSMTGFGSAVTDNDQRMISVEVKSLNSKFLDANLRLPKEYLDKEIEVRNILTNTVERGKVSLCIELQQKGEVKPKMFINRPLVKQYYTDLLETANEVGADTSDLFRLALGMPKAMESEIESAEDEEEWKQILDTLQKAIKKCDEFRLDEGRGLEEKFMGYIKRIEELFEKVIAPDPKRLEGFRQRIQSHMQEFVNSEQVDKNRFEQELIYYIEKLDISEEK